MRLCGLRFISFKPVSVRNDWKTTWQCKHHATTSSASPTSPNGTCPLLTVWQIIIRDFKSEKCPKYRAADGQNLMLLREQTRHGYVECAKLLELLEEKMEDSEAQQCVDLLSRRVEMVLGNVWDVAVIMKIDWSLGSE